MTRTNERDGLLQAILTTPDDDLHRLAYADWLNDFGSAADLQRAGFIRLQVEAAKLPEGNEPATLNQQADPLFTAHRAEWEGPLIELGVTEIGWERGFPARVGISAVDFTTNGGKLFAPAPITQAVIFDLTNDQIEALTASPHLQNLTYLDLGEKHIGDAGAQALANSPHLQNLTYLNLRGNQIGAAGAQALATSPHLTNLTYLDLWGNQIGAAGAQALATSPHLTNLTYLDLWGNQIGAAGA